jgi:hypothetical protein
MVTLDTPADGLEAFDLTPMVFREIAQWTKKRKARIVDRYVVHGEHPSVIIAYVLERSRRARRDSTA